MSEKTVIGQIVSTFGIKGEVKVAPHTDFEARFDKGNLVFIEDTPFRIQSCRWHKGRPMLKLSGIDTMTAAQNLQWKYLSAEGEPELADDEFLTEDLIDLDVKTVEGEHLGTVSEVLKYPAHEVLVVGPIMIPLIREFVKDIDFDHEVITVKLLYGMRPGED